MSKPTLDDFLKSSARWIGDHSRLSARQQASVWDIAAWIDTDDQRWKAENGGDNASLSEREDDNRARALLAKYDIFEKVEG